MENWLFITILVVLSVAWFWLHHNSKANSAHKHKSTSPLKHPTKTYHGTSIHICSQACEAVSGLQGKRFLAEEITQLPVYGCNNSECSCTYIHHEDRRNGDDRRYPSIIMEGVFNAGEHRMVNSDRRKQIPA